MKLIVSNDQILYAPKFSRFQDKGSDSYIVWDLTPVAIYDYVDPDYSNKQGWVQEIPYTGEIDLEQIVQYTYVESFKNALEDFGYAFIDVDTIYVKDVDDEGNVVSTKLTAEEAVDNAFDLW